MFCIEFYEDRQWREFPGSRSARKQPLELWAHNLNRQVPAAERKHVLVKNKFRVRRLRNGER